jgi:PAS domain S-box-containing protein
MIVTMRNNFSNVEKSIRQQLQLIQRDAALTRNEQLRNIALESLRRTQAMLQTFISYAPAAVAMFDRNLDYIVHSRHWLSDHGLAENDLAGRNYFEVMPDSAHLMRDAFRMTLAGEVETNDQYPYIRNDGTVRWFRWEMRPWYEDGGAMGGVVMYSEDITDTKRANDALQARERLLDKLGVQVPGVMFQGRWRRDANFRFTFVSANAESLCGIGAEQLCKDSNVYLRLFDRTDRERLRHAAEAAMARAGTIHLQLRIQAPQRGIRWIQINALAERLADASVLWYGYVEDVTLRHEMALKLAKYAGQGNDDGHHVAA